MTPEEKARLVIDRKLIQSGWLIQDKNQLNLTAGPGVAVREFPTSTGPVDYALFVGGDLVGIVEAKRSEMGEHMTEVEAQTDRYASSVFRGPREKHIRFVYRATDRLVFFADFFDLKSRSRMVFSFHRPETLWKWMQQKTTLRNALKTLPPVNTEGFRSCQVTAIENLDKSLAQNKPKALIQMATGAGKTFTAITASYRMLKYGGMNRILFLVDTKSLGEQAEREFMAYIPNDDQRPFSNIFGVHRLRTSSMPSACQVYISTIQRMYSILKGEALDESLEEESAYEHESADSRPPVEVVYNAQYPPEFFDCIIVDECHRSIYNVWKQVLEYFDAFIIGLTATPDKRTFGFFNGNVVSEYTREQAILDGVNVGEDIFLIETQVTKNGAHIMKQLVETRSRETRQRRWKQLEDDIDYAPSQLDRDIVNPSQIRTVVRTFKECLYTQLFPRRSEVPKTLIFAKTDSHAEDIVQIVREEFGESDQFCQKITHFAKNPDERLQAFRNSYYPRIAVTVEMIATGTDVKPIECLIFMRDIRAKGHFEQMKGRGTRVLNKEDLQKVTPSATENKDHFVIVDAVGVTKSKKTETRTLERKPTVSLKELMWNVACNDKTEDTLTSLANRIIRLNGKMTQWERKEFEHEVGATAGQVAERLLDAFDPDRIAQRAGVPLNEEGQPVSEQDRERYERAQKEMLTEAVAPFHQPEVREFIENMRRSHEQIIDNDNQDTVLFAGFSAQQEETADRVIESFHAFIEENKDEILALRIIYDQRYKDRSMAIAELKKLYEKLKSKGITVERLWDCYAIKRPEKVKRGTLAKLTDLVSLIRFEMGYTDHLSPFTDQVNYNFMQWTLRRNAGAVHFSEEQMQWLRMIKDHIVDSLSIEPEDLDYTPFDRFGGLGRFYEVFGEEYVAVLNEMNAELVG